MTRIISVQLPQEHPLNSGATSESLLVQNVRGIRTSTRPVWFMRQAGRSLPEYRRVREGTTMLESCLTPELAVEITLQPVRRHGVDAAIFFSDIVIPLKLAGIDVEIQPGVGPVLDKPVRVEKDLDRLRLLDMKDLQPITAAVTSLVGELGSTPLIGFGGAPFTLASYLIEGGPSREMPHVRAMMKDNPALWNAILNWCADVTAQFISAQVTAGASALQVFDSWAGRLSPEEYVNFALPYSKRLFTELSAIVDSAGNAVPRVHFGVGTRAILKPMLEAGATVLGVDSDTPLSYATELFGQSLPLQGNINPDVLTEPWNVIEAHVRDVLDSGASAAGHIVNLGHGVPKDTNPDTLTRITAFVHEYSE